jgi:peptidylprolyl isomerase
MRRPAPSCMPPMLPSLAFSSLLALAGAAAAQSAPPAAPQPFPKPSLPIAAPSMAEILAGSQASDWRTPEPENVLYLEMAGGRVVIELAPTFAPRHVANVKLLARAKYFDGLVFLRSQDNYVVQWGDPNGDRELGAAKPNLLAELARPALNVPFTPLADGDVYAPEVGFSNGLPMAHDPQNDLVWLTHCYGMVGAGRGDELDSGNGSELYVVIGHSPRHLDRNVTLLGRVLQGMDLLSVLPRGKGALGFYEKPEQHVPITSIRVAADVPEKERTALEVLRTDTDLWKKLVESRRFRREGWFKFPVGKIELCNVPLPVRPITEKAPG